MAAAVSQKAAKALASRSWKAPLGPCPKAPGVPPLLRFPTASTPSSSPSPLYTSGLAMSVTVGSSPVMCTAVGGQQQLHCFQRSTELGVQKWGVGPLGGLLKALAHMQMLMGPFQALSYECSS